MIVTCEQEIRRQIRSQGRITFAKFMELALYWPHGGYYRQPGRIGALGDYYTAPVVHPVFGFLLALQIYQMWDLMERPNPFWIVDAGAGPGFICHDLMASINYLPGDFGDCVRFLNLDLISDLGDESLLPISVRSKIDRISSQNFPLKNIRGCVLSNELIDSFPVHRVVIRDGSLMEIYIALDGDEYVEEIGAPSCLALETRFRQLGVHLPEQYCAEVNLGMEVWLQAVARALQQGYVLTIDYGDKAAELYRDSRARGTLTSFYRHVQTDNPYIHIGDQDLTAQVDFSTLMQVGADCGLESLGYVSQRSLLEYLGIRKLLSGLASLGLTQAECDANRLGMLDLVRPGGMGEFKVLLQGIRVPDIPLWGTMCSDPIRDLLGNLPTPLLSSRHMPLLQGKYRF